MTVVIPPPFDGDYPVSFAQGRRGEVYVYQGHGNRGRVWSPSLNTWRNVGLEGPKLLTTAADRKPTITKSATVKYYVARIDITNNGSGYQTPPTVTIGEAKYKNDSGGDIIYCTLLAPGYQPAKALARIREGYVSVIQMTAYGKGYSATPNVTLTEPPGVLSGKKEVTPANLTTNVNNYAIAVGDIYNLTATAAVTITGIVGAGANKKILLKNVGDYPITLANQSASSTNINRIVTKQFADVPIPPGHQATLEYSLTQGRWYIQSIDPSSNASPTGATPGSATAIVRAHLRGVYQCYFRYVDETVPESEGGPIYSNLSEVTEIDCGEGAEYITWSGHGITGIPGLSVELWRTTSNQATTLFRVAKRNAAGTWEFGGLQDDLTDWELLDSTRTGWQAMPILLPNGELNANRFDVPPANYSSAVMFQDRLWMGVDTEGGNPNTLRFSEGDEPEYVPEVNELIIQSNLRATDYITALIPYAGSLVVMQSRHCHRLTYVSQPLIDTGIALMAYRGCLSQRCWDIADGMIYAMDDQGIYSMSPNGEIEDLTLGLYDIIRDKIDYELSRWFTVRADKRQGFLRVCVAVKGDGSTKFPTRQYVYSFDYKTWWEERYPQELTCATEIRLPDGQVSLVYGTSEGTLRQIDEGLVDTAEGSIGTITITNPGRGYKQPPIITASGGHGAEFECGINSDGQITGIVVKFPGTQYSDGSLTISAPESGGTQATATYTVNTGEQPVYWSYKSGCFEFTTDTQDKKAGEAQNRQCSVTYKPTQGACTLNLKTFYNNARYPRSNVVRRDRGTGFTHSDTVPAATLNMQATPLQEAEAHGVARALFAGRALDDMMGSDRHVSIALAGKQDTAGEVILHTVDIYGVNEKGDK